MINTQIGNQNIMNNGKEKNSQGLLENIIRITSRLIILIILLVMIMTLHLIEEHEITIKEYIEEKKQKESQEEYLDLSHHQFMWVYPVYPDLERRARSLEQQEDMNILEQKQREQIKVDLLDAGGVGANG
jgi:hypothetical protein